MEPGTRLQHYELIRRLGAGGMGEVFLAEDTHLHRKVAIKFLLGPSDERARARLLREARAAAALDHTNICAIHEIGADPAAGDFIVMQFVEGETLSAHIRRGPLAAARATAIAADIAAALAAAHARGLIHRDLKPTNVIVTPDGAVKLLDFGLAKLLADAPEAAEAPTALALTSPGGSPGTPGYMAPEQVRGGPVDARADLFSLGCVLYECLTGERAFDGATPADRAAAVLRTSPRAPSEVAPGRGITPRHDALCARLLAKEPGNRFQSAPEVIAALRSLSAAGPAGLRSLRVAAFGLALGLIVILAMMLSSPSRPEPPADVARLYAEGVEAIRDGQYVAARLQLSEAVGRFPNYPEAHARLAEAHSELDDGNAAKDALLKVDELVRDLDDLPAEDRRRVDAVRASVMRNHDVALSRFLELARAKPGDAGRWVDAGLAAEAASKTENAREHYEQAIALERDYAAAHLRVGSLRGLTLGDIHGGLASLDEAARLYRLRGQTEGEIEATLRKGTFLTALGRFDDAQPHLTRVVDMASDPRFLFQRVRAQFDLSRILAARGRADEAETMARGAVQAALEARLWGSAALGQIDLGNAVLYGGDVVRANVELTRALTMAVDHGARRTEMRARIAVASARSQMRKPDEAVALLRNSLDDMEPFPRLLTQARNVLARAYEDLEQYEAAIGLANEALVFAESIGDSQQIANVLDNIAGPLTRLGRLPEALSIRERREKYVRTLGTTAELPIDLINHAELLIRLGRGDEIDPLLKEFDEGVTAKRKPFVDRRNRSAMLRAMRAATRGDWHNAVEYARQCAALVAAADTGSRTAELYADYARASRAGAPRRLPPAGEPVVVTRGNREDTYWKARAALARRDHGLAWALAYAGWSSPGTKVNPEALWRFAAIAAIAARGMGQSAHPDGARMAADARAALDRLTASWGSPAADRYLGRHDLETLRRELFSQGGTGG